MKNSLNTSILKSFINFIVIFIVFSCKTYKSKESTKYYANKHYLFATLNINSLFSQYYFWHNHFPKDFDEMKDFVSDIDQRYFLDPFNFKHRVKIIPIFETKSKYPNAYIITSYNTNIKRIDSTSLQKLKDFAILDKDTVVTDKPIIYDWFTTVSLMNELFDYTTLERFIKRKQYNMKRLYFPIDKKFYKEINDSTFKYKYQNKVIIGKYFNQKVKRYIHQHIDKNIQVEAWITKRKKDTIFMKFVMIHNKGRRVKKGGLVKDEVGNYKPFVYYSIVKNK